MIELANPSISVRRQCELMGLNRSTLYYTPAQESEFNLQLMRLIDEQYTRTPFYGWPRMTAHLQRQGYPVNHKRTRALDAEDGIASDLSQAVYDHREHRAQDLSLSAAQLRDHSSTASVECRHVRRVVNK